MIAAWLDELNGGEQKGATTKAPIGITQFRFTSIRTQVITGASGSETTQVDSCGLQMRIRVVRLRQ